MTLLNNIKSRNTNLSVFRKTYLYLPVVSAPELKSGWRPSRPDYPSDRLRVPDNLWPPRIWKTPRGSPRPHCGEGTSDPVSDHQSPGCSFRKPSHSRSENILFPETPQMKISPVTFNHSVSVPNEEKPEKGRKKNYNIGKMKWLYTCLEVGFHLLFMAILNLLTWLKTGGTIWLGLYIILNKVSQMQFRMMIEHVSEVINFIRKKTPPSHFSFNLQFVSIGIQFN